MESNHGELRPKDYSENDGEGEMMYFEEQFEGYLIWDLSIRKSPSLFYLLNF